MLRNLFGVRSKPSSGMPRILRKTNKVMKWILAVPDDPDLKTHSSRRQKLSYSKLDMGASNFQRSATRADVAGTGPSRSRPTPLIAASQHTRQRVEDRPLSPETRRFHFAPSPFVHTNALHQRSVETLGVNSQAVSEQVKAGKMGYGPSVTSSETRWPTQSQVDGMK